MDNLPLFVMLAFGQGVVFGASMACVFVVWRFGR